MGHFESRASSAARALALLLACACHDELAATADILPQRYPNRLGDDDGMLAAVLFRPPGALGLSQAARASARSSAGAAEVEGTLELRDVDGDGSDDALLHFETQALRDAGLVSASAHQLELRAEGLHETWVGVDRVFEPDARLVELPAPSGPHGVGTAELMAVDETRPAAGEGARTLLLRLWYPALPSLRQPAPYFLDADRAARAGRGLYLPLSEELLERTHAFALEGVPPAAAEPRAAVLLSPGWQAPVELYGALAAELASFGYLVLGVQHPGGPGALRGEDGVPSPALDEQVPDDGTNAAWARDLEHVAEWLDDADAVAAASLDPAAAGNVHDAVAQLDPARIAALGHCFGGSAAVRADAESARIRASIALESSIVGGARTLAESAHSLIVSSPEHAQLDASIDAFLAAAGARSQGLDIAGTRYADYADTRWLFRELLHTAPDLGAAGYGLGTIGAQRGHAVIAAQVLSFLAQAWTAAPGTPREAAMAEAPGAFPEVTPHGSAADSDRQSCPDC